MDDTKRIEDNFQSMLSTPSRGRGSKQAKEVDSSPASTDSPLDSVLAESAEEETEVVKEETSEDTNPLSIEEDIEELVKPYKREIKRIAQKAIEEDASMVVNFFDAYTERFLLPQNRKGKEMSPLSLQLPSSLVRKLRAVHQELGEELPFNHYIANILVDHINMYREVLTEAITQRRLKNSPEDIL